MSDVIQLENVGNILNNIGNLLTKNQNLLKLIKYDFSDALSLSDLTILEIKNLIGKGSDPINQQRIYKYAFTNKVLDTAKSELRFFVPSANPNNIYLSDLRINFQVVIHNSLIDLDDNKQRYWIMNHEILKTLNGQDVGGVGLLYLITPITYISWSDYFSGYAFSLSTRSV